MASGGAGLIGVGASKKPRARWFVGNAGEAVATTHDWMPGKPLYEAVFGEPPPPHLLIDALLATAAQNGQARGAQGHCGTAAT